MCSTMVGLFFLISLVQATHTASAPELANTLVVNFVDRLFQRTFKPKPHRFDLRGAQSSAARFRNGHAPTWAVPSAIQGSMLVSHSITGAKGFFPKAATFAVQAADAIATVEKDQRAVVRDVALATSSPTHELPPTLNAICFGISIHKTNVSVRERVAIPMADWVNAAQELVEFAQGTIAEAAVLSTCNRFELYVTCEESRTAEGEEIVMRWLHQRSGLSDATLRDNIFVLQHEGAVEHLLRVSAGLDSLMVGEGQILSQVGACHQAAIGEGGQGGKVLARLLNQAVQSGKRVREKTGIAKGAVSISSAAIEFAVERAPKDLSKPLTESTVAIVGAGTMARLLLVHLKSKGVTRTVVCTKNIGEGSRAAALKDEFGADIDIVVRPLSEMYNVITEHDFTFTATASRDPIVTHDGLASALTAAGRTSPIILVDISVPLNVKENVESLANVLSYNVDALKENVARNTEARRGEMIKAEGLLDVDKKQWLAWHTSLAAVPTLKRLLEQAESVRQHELEKYADEFARLGVKERQVIEKLTHGLIKSLMHQPMVQLNKPQTADEKRRTIGEFNSLFDLSRGGDFHRREEAEKLLEFLAENAVSDTAEDMQTKTKMLSSRPIDQAPKGIETAPSDIKRARWREGLAELGVIEEVSCGILQATMQTLEFLEQRSEAIRTKTAAAEFKSAAAEAIGGQQCHSSAKDSRAWQKAVQESWRRDVNMIELGLGKEREAEADALDRMSKNLAEVSMETVAIMQERAEAIRQNSLSRQAKKLRTLTEAGAELVGKISRGIVNTLMALPASHLTSAQNVEEKSRTLTTFASLFEIPTTGLVLK